MFCEKCGSYLNPGEKCPKCDKKEEMYNPNVGYGTLDVKKKEKKVTPVLEYGATKKEENVQKEEVINNEIKEIVEEKNVENSEFINNENEIVEDKNNVENSEVVNNDEKNIENVDTEEEKKEETGYNIPSNEQKNEFGYGMPTTEINSISGYGSGPQILNTETNNFDIKEFINKNKTLLMIIGGIVLVIIIVVILMNTVFKKGVDDIDSSRINTLKDYKPINEVKFKMLDKEYSIGDNVTKYLKDGYVIYESSINKESVPADTIVAKTFYYEDKPMFLAAIYCPKKEACKYEETKIIKINFYQNSRVEVNGVKAFSSYSTLQEAIGEEKGTYKEDKFTKLWEFGKGNIGDAYYMITFSSYNSVTEFRIGLWWYDGERDHTIEVNNNEK